MHAMSDAQFMRLALRLARRGYGMTSPNPMVGAVLVKGGKIIGRGWHRRAGLPHAEIEALRDAQKRGHNPQGATLYVTLEPCSTHGRTPPCTDALIAAGIKRVVVGAPDPNPKHAGKGFKILERAGIEVVVAGSAGILPAGFSIRKKTTRRQDAGTGRRMRALKRSFQPLDCLSHTVRHRQSGDDAGRKNRHRFR
jgi:riboflavin biosynthesis protein RibD